MKTFFTAWSLLTIVPLPVKFPFEAERMGRSALYYPVIGLILGGALFLGEKGLSFFFPSPLISLLLLLALVLITGGIHLDGFADTVDGLAGGNTPAERLEIMRDGRIGALAAVALFFLLALKLLLLASLPAAVRSQGWIAFPFVGRSMMVPAAFLSTYPRAEGLGKAFVGKIPSWAGAGAFAIFIFGMIFLFQFLGLMMALLLLSGSVLYERWISRRTGGITGDHLGCLCEGGEVLFLMMLYLVYPIEVKG